jgi:tRNA nucleotidyltransferase/poly(A) polymerase
MLPNIQKNLQHAQVYICGGYVRDRLLGRNPTDHDFVVVGATPQDMIDAGFKQVGADFPVFLHPNGDQYTLARTERKVSAGYNGFETTFTPDITLEDDLTRRDLTINAMARKVLDWNEQGHAKLSDDIIDPFNGQQDLKDGVLRHVSEHFRDDPVRALRVARFAARYDFNVCEATKQLIIDMDKNGEFDALVADRVWLELQKAIMEPKPHFFFSVLMDCGVCQKILKGKSEFHLMRLVSASMFNAPLHTRLFAVGFTSEEVALLKGPSNMIDFLKRCEQCDMNTLLDVNITLTDICQIFKSFNAIHEDNPLCEMMIDLIKFRSMRCQPRLCYKLIEPRLLKSIRDVHLPEDTQIAAKDRNDWLWNVRRDVIDKYINDK